MRGKTNALIGGGGGGSTPTEEKTVQAVEFPTVVEPRAGYALSKATVTAPDNLIAENIKKGVTIAGVTGTVSGEAFPNDWVGAAVSTSYYSMYSHTVDFQKYSGTETIYCKNLSSNQVVFSPSTYMFLVGANPHDTSINSNNRVIATVPEKEITMRDSDFAVTTMVTGTDIRIPSGTRYLCKGAVYREIGRSAYDSNTSSLQLGGEFNSICEVVGVARATPKSISYSVKLISVDKTTYHFDEFECIGGSYSTWSSAYVNYRTGIYSLEKIS